MNTHLPSFLPGQLLLARGTPHDYRALERFHYRPNRPATWAGVWVVRYHPSHEPRRSPKPGELVPWIGESPRIVAVAVLSYPTVNSTARDRALKLTNVLPRRKLAFVNRNLRTISRVIVHPQFRSLGLASRLVREICRQAPTRYVEAFAVMGRVHPFFEKGGMVRRSEDGGWAMEDGWKVKRSEDGGWRIEDGGKGGPVYYLFDREVEGRCAAAGDCAR